MMQVYAVVSLRLRIPLCVEDVDDVDIILDALFNDSIDGDMYEGYDLYDVIED